MLNTIANKILKIRGSSLFARNVYFMCQSVKIRQEKLPASIKTFSSNSSNPDETKLIQLIKLEVINLLDQGARVPQIDSISPHHWEELLKLKTACARKKYYHFLFVTEMRREKSRLEKEEKTRAYLQFKAEKSEEEPEENSHVQYGLGKTTFFMRINKGTITAWRNDRLRQAMQFGDKIIYDCSYDQYMTPKESKSAAKQLMISFAENRHNKQPFDLHFCNVNFNGNTFTKLERYIPTIRNEEFPLHLHEESYLDLFPKEKLVYLTPHCTNDLVEYDPDSIYIVGAMVDKGNKEPLSQGKAKQQKIKMARLPLDRYLDWGSSSNKSLTLDQMMRIMLEIKNSRSWDSALKNVPNRKVVKDVKEIRKWTANVSPFTGSFPNKKASFDFNITNERREARKWTRNDTGSFRNENTNFDLNLEPVEQTKLSTAEKFKRNPVADNKSKSQFTNNFERTDAGREKSTYDKVKKSNRKVTITDILKE